jgi:uncharacterized protein (DUF169 family)
MKSMGWNLSAWMEVFKKLKLEAPAVGVSFSIKPPTGLKRLDDKMRLCEMLKCAHEGKSFYADPDNHTCDAGLYVMGKTVPSVYSTGEYGAGLQIFNHTRAARRVYDFIPKFDAGSNISYVAFSPLEKLTFAPDLLVVLAGVETTEILLRALSYSTGKMWTSKYSSVIGCAWIYIYPYLTGELNYAVTGLSFGMRAKKIFKPGLQLISIPHDLLPTMLHNIQTMPWVLPMFRPDGEEFRKKLRIDLGLDPNH